MPRFVEGQQSAEGLEFGIVVARWNAFVTEALLEGAVKALVEKGARDEDIVVVRVPGAFEIGPAAASLILRVSGVICLGAVIRGGTPHFEYVSRAVTDAVNRVAMEHAAKAVVFGVLTTDDVKQAEERAGEGEANKGREAALACIEMVHVLGALGRGSGGEPRPLERRVLPAKKGKA